MTPSDPALPDVKPPRCAMCRTRMALVARRADAGGGESCTFTCPTCAFTKTKLIGGPPDLSRQRPRKVAPSGDRRRGR